MEKTTTLLKTLGKKIAFLRKRKGLNQEEFADISGKMINTISNIERGLSDPKLTTIISLAEALNIPVSALFDETGNISDEILPVELNTIIELIKNEDTKTLNIIHKQIKALLELKDRKNI